ncbi:transcriptional regulator, partial [Enterococcus faecalis]
MRTSTVNYIKDILADFYKTDEYIREREEELRHAYQEAELNAGIRGQRLHSV